MFKPFFLEPAVIKGRRMRSFQEFVDAETLGGIVLLACIAVTLLWANSPWSASYTSLWQTRFTIGVGGFALNIIGLLLGKQLGITCFSWRYGLVWQACHQDSPGGRSTVSVGLLASALPCRCSSPRSPLMTLIC